ncbi:hypothetical protein AFM18_08480 [Achromobacter spanius]|uniref:Uncharacterized protein n=1 Tax=Achromobacter spanius TaxID=217203 RepID=A0AAW3I601_9BURK|nr:hypothetical protein AFM18_08480 [Achromobacter spanius]
MAAALMAGLANATGAAGATPATSRSRNVAIEPGAPLMFYGTRKSASGSVAQAKRAAAKQRNRIRNKRAHRG